MPWDRINTGFIDADGVTVRNVLPGEQPAFQIQPPFTRRTASQYYGNFRNRWGREYNVTFAKSTAFREGMNLQFRAESFNPFNHPIFGNDPILDVTSANFGKYSGTNFSRQIQLGIPAEFLTFSGPVIQPDTRIRPSPLISGYLYQDIVLWRRHMISQTTEYALRAVVVLAGDAKASWTAQAISSKSMVPQDYLMKVLQLLARAGLVTAQRGRGGGFVLTRTPDQINVLEVVTAVDPLRRIKECPLGIKAHSTILCPLHRKLDNAIRLVEEAFASTTIGEILADPSPIRPLCQETGALCDVQMAN